MRLLALALATAALLLPVPTVTLAQQIHPINMVSGVDSTSDVSNYQRTFYTVPAGMDLVLTDMTTQGSANPVLLFENSSVLRYVLTKTPTSNFMTLATGLVFQPGSTLTLLVLDSGWTRFAWSGYLVPEVVGGAPNEDTERRLGFAVGPNPSGQVVELRFELGKPADVSLRIYDVQGRLVTTLADARLPAGRHDLTWTGKNTNGEAVAAGVYFARLESSKANSVRRLVRVR